MSSYLLKEIIAMMAEVDAIRGELYGFQPLATIDRREHLAGYDVSKLLSQRAMIESMLEQGRALLAWKRRAN